MSRVTQFNRRVKKDSPIVKEKPLMKKFIFRKKTGGDIYGYLEILRQELEDIHKMQVFEFSTEKCICSSILPNDNTYVYSGTDMNRSFLKKAVMRFRNSGFNDTALYVARADALPFYDESFNICLCFLSVNFFSDILNVFGEIRRMLVPGGIFICSVPVHERNSLTKTCQKYGFSFERILFENGTLLCFKAICNKDA